MPLPPDLNKAIAASGGGRVALVLGAGCSFEAPTSVPVARVCSQEIHTQLVADGVLSPGDCAYPDDLSAVADAVYAKTGLQQPLVSRMRERYQLHARPANEGYLIAAALMCERAVASVVTLNYDVALTAAVIELSCADVVGIIEGPQHLPDQKVQNVYYLHRSANAADPETWVLRTVTILSEWQGQWEQAITNHVLVRPVVVFAGLGTAVTVLLESTRLMRLAIPHLTRLFQVNPSPSGNSGFFQQMNLPVADYIQMGWGDFMCELSDRLVVEHSSQVETSVAQKIHDDGIASEDVKSLLTQLQIHGIVKSGKLRATWLLHEKKRYLPMDGNVCPLIADLLLGIALIARISNTHPSIADDGMVEFRRGAVISATLLIASGAGHRRTSTIEARLNHRKPQWRGRPFQPTATLVAGTSEVRPQITPPMDVVRGNDTGRSIIAGPARPSCFHVDTLRETNALIGVLVP